MALERYFFNPIKIGIIIGSIGLLAVLLMSYSSKPPKGKTGAPGESTCTACHSIPTPGYEGDLSIEGLPSTFTPNETYTLTVKGVSTGTASPIQAGFQLVVIYAMTEKGTGTLTVTSPMTTSTQTDLTLNREYLNHKGAQSFENDEVSWTFEWTAPAEEGEVAFYASSIFGNGSGSTGDILLLTHKTVVIESPIDVLSVTIDNVVLPNCHGGAASAHAEVTGGTPPYQYLWSNGETTETAINLPEETYFLTVTDAMGDTAKDTVNIDDPSPINIEILASTPTLLCGASVVLKASAVGGTGDFAFVWQGGIEDSLEVSEPGLYCVVATDENGCTAIACQGVNEDVNNVFCNGISTDTITCQYPSRKLFPGVTANDTITYSWTGPNGFMSSDTFPNAMEGGLYELTATIPNGCSCTSSIEVQSRLELKIEIDQIIDATCGMNGQLLVDITEGNIAPFTAFPNVDIDSLAKGDYSVIVSNGDGCKDTVEFTIGGVDPISIMVDEVLPDHGAQEGAISVTASGGEPPFDFTWKLGGDEVSTDEDVVGLTSGFYQVLCKDASGCLFSLDSIEVPFVSRVVDLAFAKNIFISPNPATDYFNILFVNNDMSKSVVVSIFNINNRLVRSFEFFDKKKQVDVSQLPVGVYQIMIQSGQKFASKRLIIRK